MRPIDRVTLLAAGALAAITASSLVSVTSDAAESQQLGAVDQVEADGPATTFSSGDARLRITFLDDAVFRVELAPDGTFTDPANDPPQDPDAPSAPIIVGDTSATVTPELTDVGDAYLLATGEVNLTVGKDPILLTAATPDGTVLFSETAPLNWESGTTQTLDRTADEQFLGGGMQNGRFSHRDQTIQISANYNWTDGGWPNAVPWYMSSSGYGVLRNTFAPGSYTFGEPVRTTHNEARYDAYYVVGDFYAALDGYTALTGRPMMPPIYGLEKGDADCYNTSSPTSSHPPTEGKLVTTDALAVAAAYDEHDMPRGWMLVNDGYGCEYVDLVETGEGLRDHNIALGLWTERALADQEFEVAEAGVRVRKLDVAWVGPGYRHALTACEDAHRGIEEYSDARGFVWMVEGWAGSQRCGVQWTGDHSGDLDAIRWQIPAIHGSGNSGLAFTAGDVDGIYGGSGESYVRDLQWKVFSPVFMSMSGWAGFDKQPWTRGEPYTSINRDYLKLRERLLPYFYTYAAEAHRTGAPLAKSMILEYPDDPMTWDGTTTHQFLAGREFLVAPVYTDSDVRDGIYLPEGTWVDYWSGRITTGPVTLDGYEAPLDRLPLFVKAGAVIPMWPEGINNHAEVEPDDRLTLDVYPWGDGSFELYEDDGVTREHATGASASQRFTVSAPEGGRGAVEVTIGTRDGDYAGMSASRPYEITAHTGSKPGAVVAGNRALPQLSSPDAYDAADIGWVYADGTVLVKTADLPSDETLTVRLAGTSSVGGPDPDAGSARVTIDAPDELSPGIAAEVEVSVTNAASRPIRQVAVDIEAPDGWSSEPVEIGQISAGDTVTRTLSVTPPASGSAGRNTITATATWTARSTTHHARAATSVTVPYGNLAEAHNVVAVTDDDNPGPGNFDGSGNSYSAQALAEAGVTPGATVTSRGVDFTWPEAAPGTPNAVRAAGQTIALEGQGTHLAFLGAEAGFQVGEFIVRYADGTEDRQSMQLPNWCCAPQDAGGSTVAFETFYRNTQNGPANHGVSYAVFHNEIQLHPGREVSSIVLPDTPAIVLFDVAFAERELPDPPDGDVWVSDLDWISATNGWGPVERDMSNGENAAGDGRTISIRGTEHEKGLGVHAHSEVQLYLGRACTSFSSTIGIDDEVLDNQGPTYATVRFSVVGDGAELYRSAVLTRHSDPVEIDVDVEDVHVLTLIVDDAGDGITGDHADWASARLSC
jgi:alpha-glucosidase (family GH31 glycosyl hydrolase)